MRVGGGEVVFNGSESESWEMGRQVGPLVVLDYGHSSITDIGFFFGGLWGGGKCPELLLFGIRIPRKECQYLYYYANVCGKFVQSVVAPLLTLPGICCEA